MREAPASGLMRATGGLPVSLTSLGAIPITLPGARPPARRVIALALPIHDFEFAPRHASFHRPPIQSPSGSRGLLAFTSP
jgi:hypothetical protein